MTSRDELGEFKQGAHERPAELNRRDLMRLLSASVALAGIGACTQSPREKILPYARRLVEVTPGVARYYATSMELDGFAIGLLAKSHEGRPTKIEGNPEHPMSLGATSAFEQASVLDLYDPARVRAPRLDGTPASWAQMFKALAQPPSWRPWLVLPPQGSPLVQSLVTRVLERYPGAKLCYDSPLSRRTVYQATRAVFGRALEPQYDFSRARVTLALDADFLSGMPMSVRWSRDFAARRRQPVGEAMARLYVVETTLTPSGGMADHRLAVAPSQVVPLAASILRELSLVAQPAQRLPEALLRDLPRAQRSAHAEWIAAVARDLARAPGESIVIAGDQAPVELHLLAHALNAALGNLGRTVTLTEPALIEPEGGYTLAELVAAIQAKSVDAVLILGGNPVYTAPRELELTRWLGEVSQSVHLALVENETSRACQWVLPQAHYLESWGDARAYDGTISMVQPLIEPLYPAKSVVELLAACAGEASPRGHALLTAYWRGRLGARFEASWEELLKRGLLPNSASPTLLPAADWTTAASLLPPALAASSQAGSLELYFEPSPSVYDGRFASNAWLLELPHPMTKQTWGNAALISPGTASALGVGTGQLVELEAAGHKLEAPIIILPGHADNAVTLSLGYGQAGPELLGRGVGVNAYPLRARDGASWRPVELRVTTRKISLAITQDYGHTRGRPLALSASAEEYARNPDLTAHLRGPQPSAFPIYSQTRPGIQWAMTIDTSICTGCSSCVVACQAENNIPVVGQAEVERGREMHWLRIDRYFSEVGGSPGVVQQPMLCQHCEAAPCEYVCPVNATVHSPDGLNEMVYNRCIGTRFCSNNCPYKVRRFNWFEYTSNDSTVSLQRNPDVTVRERGVMEKCTYCVQRIRRAEMAARVEQREILPGEVVTACQQACPTQAIQFGALEHAGTAMVEWRKEGRSYSALHDLGTRPRTQYLAKIFNLNPELRG